MIPVILVILVGIVCFFLIGCGAFVALPHILDDLVDAYDEWVHVFHRIKRRTKR